MPIKAEEFDPVVQYIRNKLPQLGFFSTLDELIRAAPHEKMPAKQWQEYLKPGQTLTREGVQFPLKQEELQYSAIPALDKLDPEGSKYLEEEYSRRLGHPVEFSPNSISKEALLEHIRANGPSFNLRIGSQYPEGDAFTSQRARLAPEIDAIRSFYPDDVEQTQQLSTRLPDFRESSYGEYAHTPGIPNSYEENITTSPDFGQFPSHFTPRDISWSRTTRHYLDPITARGHGTALTPAERLSALKARLVEEIQSDRHEAAAEKVLNLNDNQRRILQDLTGYNPSHLKPSIVEELAKKYPEESQDLQSAIQRQGYRTPGEDQFLVERNYYSPSNLPDQSVIQKLLEKPPDTPFKDPADYGLLELKKQLINSVNQGDQYLGLIDPQSQIERYGTEEGRDAGMQHVYGKVYPSALRKLARQYGAEVSDLTVPIGGTSADFRPWPFREAGVDTVPEYHNLATEDDNYGDRMRDLIDTYEDQLGDPHGHLTQAKNHLREIENLLDNPPPVHTEDESDYANEEQWRYALNSHQADLVRHLMPVEAAWNRAKAVTGPMVSKTFQAMHITPEVAEKVKKAGVPLFTAAGAAALGSGNDGNGDQVTTPQFGEGGSVAEALSRILSLRGRLETALDGLKTWAGTLDHTAANQLNQSYLRAVSAHGDAMENPSAENISKLANHVSQFEQQAAPHTAPPSQVAGYAAGGTADPYPQELTQIANENPQNNGASGINWLVNAAMMRLGYMPPAFALYNPPPSFASGGSTNGDEDSDGSLREIAHLARKFGWGPGEERARLAVGLAKHFYGLDPKGHLEFLGDPGFKRGPLEGNPEFIDQMLATPSALAGLLGYKGPQFSQDAQQRLNALNKRVQQVTGVGEPKDFVNDVIDMGTSLASPMPVAGGNALGKLSPALEWLLPVRPALENLPRDSAIGGGILYGAQSLADRLSKLKSSVTDTGTAASGLEN